VGLSLTEFNAITRQAFDKLGQAITVEANVVNTTRTQRTGSRVVHILLIARCLQVRILVRRMPRLTDVQDILLTNIEPLHRKSKIGMKPICEAEIFTEPIARTFGVMRQDECVF